jgi:hypothetical protein
MVQFQDAARPEGVTGFLHVFPFIQPGHLDV